MVFLDSVTKEQIGKYANDIEANGKDVSLCFKPDINTSYRIGGKVKDRYYELDGINVKLKLKVYSVQGNFH